MVLTGIRACRSQKEHCLGLADLRFFLHLPSPIFPEPLDCTGSVIFVHPNGPVNTVTSPRGCTFANSTCIQNECPPKVSPDRLSRETSSSENRDWTYGTTGTSNNRERCRSKQKLSCVGVS